MSSPALRHIVMCALIFIGCLSFAAENSEQCKQAGGSDPEAIKCLRAACEAQLACNTAATKADADAASRAAEAKATIGGRQDIFNASAAEKAMHAKAANDFMTGKKACENAVPSCKSPCNLAGIRDVGQKQVVTNNQATCKSNIESKTTNLAGKESTERAAAGQTGKVSDNSGGNGNPANQDQQQQNQNQQQQQQSPQQSPQSSPQSTPQSPQQSSSSQTPADSNQNQQQQAGADPCQGANASLYAQCKGVVKEKCKNATPGAVGFSQPDPECTGGSAAAVASATCARFKQQCAGDSKTCLATMSATDRAKIQSECLSNGSEAEAVRQGTAGFATASAGISTGGGGGGGGGASVGSSSGATLDDLANLKLPLGADSQREGAQDGMRVDAAGGYSSDPGGGPGDSGGSAIGMGGAKTSSADRSIAADGGIPPSANATDVTNRYGPSVFSISSEVLRARCSKGRLLHCAPSVK